MMYYFDHYVVDWDKVTTLEDLKTILKALQFSWEPNTPLSPEVLQLVRLEKKPPIGTMLL